MGDVVKAGAVKCSIAGSPSEAVVWIDAQRGVALAIGENAIQFTYGQARELAGLIKPPLTPEQLQQLHDLAGDALSGRLSAGERDVIRAALAALL